MITINIPSGVDNVTASPAYQWNYGQILRITGDDLPALCEVHFCTSKCEKATVMIASTVNGGLEVTIPDKMFEYGLCIHAFIYVDGEASGQTIKHIQIPIFTRTKPEDYVAEIPPSVQTEIEKMIANINGMVEQAEEFYTQGITEQELRDIIQEESLTSEKIQKVITESNGRENYHTVEFTDTGKLVHKVQNEEQSIEYELARKTDIVFKTKYTGINEVTIAKPGIYLVHSTEGSAVIDIPDLNGSAATGDQVYKVTSTNYYKIRYSYLSSSRKIKAYNASVNIATEEVTYFEADHDVTATLIRAYE